MLTRNQAKELIKDTVQSSFHSYALGTINSERKFQILDLLIPRERKIRSIVGGLETSLGTTLWEPLAKSLAAENDFEVVDSNLEAPANMPSNLNNTLQTIIDERKRLAPGYNADSCHNEIKRVCQGFVSRPITDFESAPRGKGVDIWLKKDHINYFFDTKTVQPNLAKLTDCMTQVLYWYAYFYSRYPQQNAVARIVFPYNPHDGDFWEKTIGKGKPLERDNEAWVQNQFWDFCSGLEGTYEIILESFNELRESGVLEDDIRTMLS